MDFIRVKVKVPLCSIKHHAMNMYGGGNLQLNATTVLATLFVKCGNGVEGPRLKGRHHATEKSERWENGCKGSIPNFKNVIFHTK